MLLDLNFVIWTFMKTINFRKVGQPPWRMKVTYRCTDFCAARTSCQLCVPTTYIWWVDSPLWRSVVIPLTACISQPISCQPCVPCGQAIVIHQVLFNYAVLQSVDSPVYADDSLSWPDHIHTIITTQRVQCLNPQKAEHIKLEFTCTIHH